MSTYGVGIGGNEVSKPRAEKCGEDIEYLDEAIDY